MQDKDSLIDHISIIDERLNRRYIFITHKPIDKAKAESFV